MCTSNSISTHVEFVRLCDLAVTKIKGGKREVRRTPGKRRQLLTKTKQHSMKSKAKGVEEFCRALLKDGFVSVSSSHWWSSVLSFSLSRDGISFRVVNMMGQLERGLSMTIYLFSPRSTSVSSPG